MSKSHLFGKVAVILICLQGTLSAAAPQNADPVAEQMRSNYRRAYYGRGRLTNSATLQGLDGTYKCKSHFTVNLSAFSEPSDDEVVIKFAVSGDTVRASSERGSDSVLFQTRSLGLISESIEIPVGEIGEGALKMALARTNDSILDGEIYVTVPALPVQPTEVRRAAWASLRSICAETRPAITERRARNIGYCTCRKMASP